MLSISWNTQGSPILRLWSLKYNTSIYIEIKSYRTEYNMSCWRFTGIWWPDLLGHLQETGFWHQEVYNNQPYSAPLFSIKGAWILTQVRYFFGAVLHHLYGLLAFRLKSLFLDPTTHFSICLPMVQQASCTSSNAWEFCNF